MDSHASTRTVFSLKSTPVISRLKTTLCSVYVTPSFNYGASPQNITCRKAVSLKLWARIAGRFLDGFTFILEVDGQI